LNCGGIFIDAWGGGWNSAVAEILFQEIHARRAEELATTAISALAVAERSGCGWCCDDYRGGPELCRGGAQNVLEGGQLPGSS
jgi:hypothetical protein